MGIEQRLQKLELACNDTSSEDLFRERAAWNERVKELRCLMIAELDELLSPDETLRLRELEQAQIKALQKFPAILDVQPAVNYDERARRTLDALREQAEDEAKRARPVT